MGACYGVISAKGSNPQVLFDALCAEAVEEHGDNRYNGTISTTSLVGEIKCPVQKERLTDAEVQKVYKYLDSEEVFTRINKWSCRYCKAGLCGYAEYEVALNDYGVTDKTGYIIYSAESSVRAKYANTKKEALALAKEYALRYRKPASVYGKAAMLEVACYNIKTARESNRQLKPRKKDSWVLPVYRFFFCYWAAE